MELSQKQKIFCERYIIHWNKAMAAREAGYSEKTARMIGHENLTKPYIQAYIKEIQADLERVAGISRLSQLLEFKKIAYSNMADFYTDWHTLADFNSLTLDQKASIEIIDTKVIDGIEQVKIKLHDKQKALESINKMLGYNEPEKVEVKTTSIEVESLSTDELIKRAKALKTIDE